MVSPEFRAGTPTGLNPAQGSLLQPLLLTGQKLPMRYPIGRRCLRLEPSLPPRQPFEALKHVESAQGSLDGKQLLFAGRVRVLSLHQLRIARMLTDGADYLACFRVGVGKRFRLCQTPECRVTFRHGLLDFTLQRLEAAEMSPLAALQNTRAAL